MAKGKTILFYLVDGEPTKRIKCTLSSWIGIVYKIPKTMLDECKQSGGDIITHLKHSGVYFLLGENAEGQPSVYIGQAGTRKNGAGLFSRIMEHKKNENERYYSEWKEVIVLTTLNDSFGATEISYLENQFTTMAIKAKRYDVKNGNEPNLSNISEEKESELFDYIEYAKMILGVLGHNIFEPLVQQTVEQPTAATNLPVFNYKGKLKARGILTDEGFVLLKNSEINKKVFQSAPRAAIEKRARLANIILNNITQEDILFSSQSAAAAFVGGSSLSGNVMWVTDDGKHPNDF